VGDLYSPAYLKSLQHDVKNKYINYHRLSQPLKQDGQDPEHAALMAYADQHIDFNASGPIQQHTKTYQSHQDAHDDIDGMNVNLHISTNTNGAS